MFDHLQLGATLLSGLCGVRSCVTLIDISQLHRPACYLLDLFCSIGNLFAVSFGSWGPLQSGLSSETAA